MTARTSIEIKGFHHGPNPIPAACRIGNMVVTGAIHGMSVDTETVPDDPALQTANVFRNLRHILAAANARPEDVIKVTVFLKDSTVRDLVNKEWVDMFPDPKSRPARHTMVNQVLSGALLLQIDAMAVIVPPQGE